MRVEIVGEIYEGNLGGIPGKEKFLTICAVKFLTEEFPRRRI